jgi:hypothetical protein
MTSKRRVKNGFSSLPGGRETSRILCLLSAMLNSGSDLGYFQMEWIR